MAFLRQQRRPRRHASSERPMSKTSRLTNTIHWLEKNCPNILSSIAVIISLAATAFGRAFRSFEGPWNEPILESYAALFQFFAQTLRHFSRKTDEHMRILTRFPGELLHFAGETGCA